MRVFAAPITDKVYFALFSLLGFAWFVHSLKTTWPVIMLMAAFYFLHNAVMAKGKTYISNFAMPFLMLGALMTFHGFASHFPNLLAFTANSYHSSWGGLVAGANMCINMVAVYVMFRLARRFREEKSWVFYEGFSLGANFLMIMLLMYGKYQFDGSNWAPAEDGSTYTGAGIIFAGYAININGIGPLFIQFLYINLLAFMQQKRMSLRIYHVVFITASIVIVYLAQSKTAILVLFAGVAAGIGLRKPRWIIGIAALSALLAAAYVGNYYGLSDLLPKRLKFAALVDSMNKGNTGRTDVWHDYLSNAMSVRTLLVGQGSGGAAQLLYQKPLTQPHKPTNVFNYNHLLYPHSSYVSIFIEFGGIALIFYLIFIAKILLRLAVGVYRRKIYWPFLSMYITLVLWGLSEGTLFSSMFLLFTPLVLSEVCNNLDEKAPSMTIADFYKIFLDRKLIITLSIAALVSFSFWHCMFSPQIYKSTCRITPSGNASLPVRYPGAVIARILRGNAIVRKAAEKFSLMDVYGKCTMSETVDFLQENIVHANDTLFGDMITFEILDTSPDRAVKISDFMLECLNEHIHKMYYDMDAKFVSFYSSALEEARLELLDAENDLAAFQKDNGIIQMSQQVSSLVLRISSVRENIAVKEREVFRLRTYASDGNVRLRLAEAQLSAMRQELERLEAEGSGLAPGQVPAVTLGYADRLRRVEFLRVKVLAAMNALGSFKNDSQQYLPPVYVLDPVRGSVEEFKPHRIAVMIGGTCTGIWLGIVLSIFDYKRKRA